MKLMVWTDVLCDYTCGMIVALAPSLETALHLTDRPSVREDMVRVDPEVTELGEVDAEPRVWFVFGGG